MVKHVLMNKETVYGAIADYYGGSMKFRKIKDENGWAIYAARMSTGLSVQRYLFAIVQSSIRLGEYEQLEALDWISFQTRATDDHHAVPEYTLNLDSKRKELLSDIINVVERTGTFTRYSSPELPIKIMLLHDVRKKNTLQYPDKAKLYQALETYNCVLELL